MLAEIVGCLCVNREELRKPQWNARHKIEASRAFKSI